MLAYIRDAVATIKNTTLPAYPAGRRRLISAGAAGLMLLLGACAERPSIAEVEASGGIKTATREPVTQSSGSLIRLADAALAIGDRGAAVGLYHRAANAAPGDPELLVRLGFLLHELGAQLEAEAAFRRAIAADLGNADALRGLGITLISRDMPHHAIEYLEEAIAARPDSRAYNAMGVALDMVGERVSARESYKAGLAADPGNLSLLNNLGLSLTLSGRYADAIAILGSAVDDPRATPRHRQNLALAYGLAGIPEKAAEVANTDLDMRSVRNNLGYYAWLRRQPGEKTEQALATDLDTTAAIQLADADPAPEIAPRPPLARGAAPMFDGALLAGGPLALTPGSRTGSLPYESGEAGVAAASAPPPPRPSAFSEPRNQAAQEALDTQDTRDNVIWELQSVETDDPAAKDADGQDPDGQDAGGGNAEKNGVAKPEAKATKPSDGQSDILAGDIGGESSESAAELAETEAAMNNSSVPLDEFAGLAFAPPRADAPTESAASTEPEVERQATRIEAAPPPTQIAALSPGEVAQDAFVDDGMYSAAYADDMPAADMAIVLPSRQDFEAIRESVEEFDANITALPIPAESSLPRLAAAPKTMDSGDREEIVAVPPPDGPIDGGKAGTGENTVSGSQPAPPAHESAPPGATHPGGHHPADAPLATARETEATDPSPPRKNGATTVAGGPPPPPDPAAEPDRTAEAAIATPPAKSDAKGGDAAGLGGPARAGLAADAVTPPESFEYNTFVAESDVNTPPNTRPETVLALASPPQDSMPSPMEAASRPPDSQLMGNQAAAVPPAEAMSANRPPGLPPGRPAERNAEPPPLLRSGISLGLGRAPSAREERHGKSMQLASAEPAPGMVGRAQVGSLTPADRPAAALTAATVALGGMAGTGVSPPLYGVAALILAGLLSLLWLRRRRRIRSAGGTPAESDFVTDSEPDAWGGR